MNIYMIIVIFSILILGVFTVNLASAQVDPLIDIAFLQTGELNTFENQFHISNEYPLESFLTEILFGFQGKRLKDFRTSHIPKF